MASAGGVPRRVRPDFDAALYPTWSPDGAHLLFVGDRDNKLLSEGSLDWWVTPLDAGPAIRTGALEATRREKLGGPFQEYPWVLVAPTWQLEGDSLIFSAHSGDSTNLWGIGVSPKTWKVSGLARRLTSGPTLEEKPSVAVPGGSVRVAFASVTETANIWGLPIEANQGKVVGEPQRLTLDAARDFHPALSADGTRMVFVSDRTGSQEIWTKDVRSGEESALTASHSQKYRPDFSPDASRVSFSSLENGKWNIFVMPTMGGAAEMVCEDCGQATDWSSDGKRIAGNDTRGRVWLVDLPSRRKTELVAKAGGWFYSPRFSPDNRWITFGSQYVAPFRGEAP